MSTVQETAMRWIVTVVLLGAQTSALPPPFPREGATRMFDNARVQVWDVAWLRREYPLHRHPYDLVVVYYAPGDRIITSQTGERRPVSTPAWDTAFRRRGLTHIEEGTSDPPLRAVFIEMKDEPRPDVLDTGGVPPFPAVAGKQLLDNDRTTVWEFVRWPAGGTEHRHRHDAVVAAFRAGKPQVSFTARGTTHTDEGVAGAERVYVFEIK